MAEDYAAFRQRRMAELAENPEAPNSKMTPTFSSGGALNRTVRPAPAGPARAVSPPPATRDAKTGKSIVNIDRAADVEDQVKATGKRMAGGVKALDPEAIKAADAEVSQTYKEKGAKGAEAHFIGKAQEGLRETRSAPDVEAIASRQPEVQQASKAKPSRTPKAASQSPVTTSRKAAFSQTEAASPAKPKVREASSAASHENVISSPAPQVQSGSQVPAASRWAGDQKPVLGLGDIGSPYGQTKAGKPSAAPAGRRSVATGPIAGKMKAGYDKHIAGGGTADDYHAPKIAKMKAAEEGPSAAPVSEPATSSPPSSGGLRPKPGGGYHPPDTVMTRSGPMKTDDLRAAVGKAMGGGVSDVVNGVEENIAATSKPSVKTRRPSQSASAGTMPDETSSAPVTASQTSIPPSPSTRQKYPNFYKAAEEARASLANESPGTAVAAQRNSRGAGDAESYGPSVEPAPAPTGRSRASGSSGGRSAPSSMPSASDHLGGQFASIHGDSNMQGNNGSGNQNIGSGTQNVVTHNHYYAGSGSSRSGGTGGSGGGNPVPAGTSRAPRGHAGVLGTLAYAALNTEVNGRSANDAMHETTGRHLEVYDRGGTRLGDSRTDAKKYGQAMHQTGRNLAGNQFGQAVHAENAGMRVNQNPGTLPIQPVTARPRRMNRSSH